MAWPAVLVLNRKSLAERRLDRWLEEPESSVVLVTTKAALQHAPFDPGRAFAGLGAVEDYYSWDVELTAEYLGLLHRVELIASSSEDDVIRAARLRERLGLLGQTTASALAYRDKLLMKQACRDAGVRTPEFASIQNPMDLLQFLYARGLPIVVKPRCGAGSDGVQVLRSEDQLRAFLRVGALSAVPGSSEGWMAETYVDGGFYHIDGLMASGQVLHSWPSQYSSGNLESARSSTPLWSVMLDHDDPLRVRLTTFAQQVIAALPATPFPTSFHLEAWMTQDGPIFCEVAARTGGGPIARAYERAFGVHLSRESIRGQAGRSLSLGATPSCPPLSVGWLLLAPGHGRFVPPRDRCPVDQTEFTLALQPGIIATGADHAGDTAASAVVVGRSAQDVSLRLQNVLEWWDREPRWAD